MNRYKFLEKEHIHTLDGQPLKGNTTVLGVIAKNLTWWASELAAVECLETDQFIPTIRQEYEDAVNINLNPDKKKAIDALQKKYPIFKKARFAHHDRKNETASDGTSMHESLESYVKWCIENNEGKPKLFETYKFNTTKIFAEWSMSEVSKFIASEGNSYHEKLWVGGILDLLYLDKQGKLVLLDFKSSKEVFRSRYLQNAGMDLMISENGVLDADGNLIYKLENPVSYYGVFPFGAVNPKPSFYYNTELAKKVYASVVEVDAFINLK